MRSKNTLKRIGRKASLVFWLGLVVAGLGSCVAEEFPLRLNLPEGPKVLYYKDGPPPQEEVSTPEYRYSRWAGLADGGLVSESGYLYFGWSGDSGALEVQFAKKDRVLKSLGFEFGRVPRESPQKDEPDSAPRIVTYVPAGLLEDADSFRIVEKTPGKLALVSLGVASSMPLVGVSSTSLTLPFDSRLELNEGGDYLKVDFASSPPLSGNGGGQALEILRKTAADGLSPGSEPMIEPVLELTSFRPDRQAFRLSLRKSDHLYSRAIPAAYIAGGLAGLVYRSYSRSEEFSLSRKEGSANREGGEKDFWAPIRSDLGLALDYPQASWRRQTYEWFRWDRFPDILLFDFDSLETQDAYVKRLAFFVEKRGFRSRLLGNEELAGKHGWNANNYRAEDLARFFNEAEDSRFPLNAEEKDLADLLVSSGVLVRKGKRYEPGRGGFISVARRGLDRINRILLLNHEALHGVFYEDEKFRDLSEELYGQLGAEASGFIQRYFDYMGYDRDDPYLMINEFQAYLLQQSLEELPFYLRKMAQRAAPSLAGDEGAFRAVVGELVEKAGLLRDHLLRTWDLNPQELSGLNVIK